LPRGGGGGLTQRKSRKRARTPSSLKCEITSKEGFEKGIRENLSPKKNALEVTSHEQTIPRDRALPRRKRYSSMGKKKSVAGRLETLKRSFTQKKKKKKKKDKAAAWEKNVRSREGNSLARTKTVPAARKKKGGRGKAWKTAAKIQERLLENDAQQRGPAPRKKGRPKREEKSRKERGGGRKKKTLSAKKAGVKLNSPSNREKTLREFTSRLSER